MATAILDQLLKSQFGKSLIMWFFLAMGAAIATLGWWCYFQAAELKQCNMERVQDNRMHEGQKLLMTKERISELQLIISRLEAVEKKRKK